MDCINFFLIDPSCDRNMTCHMKHTSLLQIAIESSPLSCFFCVLVSIKYLNTKTFYLKTYKYNDYGNAWYNEYRCSVAEEDKSADDRTQSIDEARYVVKHVAVN